MPTEPSVMIQVSPWGVIRGGFLELPERCALNFFSILLFR
jgi:hypothetical protein